jgi:hypothetical protein
MLNHIKPKAYTTSNTFRDGEKKRVSLEFPHQGVLPQEAQPGTRKSVPPSTQKDLRWFCVSTLRCAAIAARFYPLKILSKQNPARAIRAGFSIWCERRGSNPHIFRHRILSPARLPIPPRSHAQCFYNKPLTVSRGKRRVPSRDFAPQTPRYHPDGIN